MSTAYHPQTDGQTERMNQELEGYLRIFCGNNPESWSEKLVDAEFAHNQRINENTKMSPFQIIMGYEPHAIPLIYPRSDVPAVADRLQNLQKIRDEALAAHELSRQKMAERIRSNFKPFEKGQKVWLEGKNLKLGYEHQKLAPKRVGPFIITEVLGPLTYRLQLPAQWKIHPVFHASLLSAYHENEVHGPNYPQPPPDLINDEEEYEVEAILSHRKRFGVMRYLVKWKGYSSAENSWEPESHLHNAPEILAKYKRRHHLN